MWCRRIWLQLVTVLNVMMWAEGAAGPATLTKKAECAARMAAACEGGGARRAVCGSDNQTYQSRCQLLRLQCAGQLVTFKHKGPCADAQPCFVSLNYARSAKRSPAEGAARAASGGAGAGSGAGAFVPKCRADGTYAAVQCHPDTGCWCVNPLGQAVPNTAVRNGRPKCHTTGKSYTRRRSSTRGQGKRKACTRSDKRQFNANLLKSFTAELERARGGGAPAAPPPPPPDELARAVAQWKFTEMDKDASGTLQKPEYRGLRRILKKVVKPRQCARTFARACDVDRDEAISNAEWISCLTGDGMNYEEGAITERENGQAAEHDYAEEGDPISVLPGKLMKVQFPESENPMARSDDIDSNDCLTDRKTALDDQRNGNVLYVPECTTDGRYRPVQCYPSTGYCWCVHEDSGKPIEGSSVKDQHPKCEALPTLDRPMKGCPKPLKTNFLRELINFFISKMTESTNGTTPGSTELLKWQAPREEQAATWTFVMLDKDKSKALERREWRSLHALLAAHQQLNKCGKKLPRYCDVNHDRKISITEWLSCLNAQRTAAAPHASPAVNTTTDTSQPIPTSKRKGPNPLDSILKSD